MKKTVCAPLALVLFALAAFALLPAPARAAADVLAKLNLPAPEAKESVLQALAGGTAYHHAAYAAFKALPAPARAAVVDAGLGWIKAYAAGSEFPAAYEALRQQEKPEAPAARPAADDEMAKMKAEMEQNIAELRQNMAAMDAEMKKQMEAVIREMRAQIERLDKDPQQRDLMRQGAALAAAEDQKRHQEELKEWQQRYPADVRQLIRRRIQEFLTVSASVDFAAALKPRGDKMVFVREDYEQKPPEWKLCFRAGREATLAARRFAENWLQELGNP